MTSTKIKPLLCLLFIAIVADAKPTPKNLNTGYFMSTTKEYDCSKENLKLAAQLREDYLHKLEFVKYMTHHDMYIGYPNGKCGFVKTQKSCEPISNFDFLRLYYCGLPTLFGHGWALILFGGVLICVSNPFTFLVILFSDCLTIFSVPNIGDFHV